MTLTKFCTNCGSQFSSQPKFCPECGTPALINPEILESNQVLGRGDQLDDSFFASKSWRYIQVGIAALVVIFTANYFLAPEKEEAPQLNYQTIPATPVVSETPKSGRWVKNCINVQVPNPNYGKDLLNQNMYLLQEQCSQAYVQD